DGDRLAAAALGGERRLDRRELFEVLGDALEEVARLVVLARRRAEETELGRLAREQAELAVGDRDLGPLVHPEGDDAERLQRRGHARDRRDRALDADVVA